MDIFSIAYEYSQKYKEGTTWGDTKHPWWAGLLAEKDEEISRLKARNEELEAEKVCHCPCPDCLLTEKKKREVVEAERDRLNAENAELTKKMQLPDWQEKSILLDEMHTIAEERDRLTSALARAHEALEDVRDANHFDYRDKSENCEKAHYVIALPLGVDRKITKLLLDKDGSLAFEKWKKMVKALRKVVEAAKFVPRNIVSTDPISIRVVANLKEALEAYESRGKV